MGFEPTSDLDDHCRFSRSDLWTENGGGPACRQQEAAKTDEHHAASATWIGAAVARPSGMVPGQSSYDDGGADIGPGFGSRSGRKYVALEPKRSARATMKTGFPPSSFA